LREAAGAAQGAPALPLGRSSADQWRASRVPVGKAGCRRARVGDAEERSVPGRTRSAHRHL